MSSNTAPFNRLRGLHAAGVRVPGAALPLVANDPRPAVTLALHLLWAGLRNYISLSANGEPGLVPQGAGQTPLQMLEALQPLLVSHFEAPSGFFFCLDGLF
jgi:hypothetical protein